jgi:hypothetical protein
MAKDPDFFVDESVQEMAEDHASMIQSLSEREAKRVIRAYENVRRELRDRLDRIQQGTFTAQKLGTTLVQLDLAIQKMGKGLVGDMKDSVTMASEKGIENLIKELQKWDKNFLGTVKPINIRAVEAAADTTNFLFNQYDSSIESYNAFLRSKMAQSLTESVVAEDSTTEVIGRLGQIFQGEQWKLEQITRTELHGVYAKGKLAGMKKLWDDGEGSIPDLKKTLYHPMDKRTGKDSKWLNKNNLIVPVDEPFKYTWNGQVREYMAPPDRPNDRSILIPYRDAWG